MIGACKKVLTFPFVVFAVLVPQITFAHCPLCTIGAGAAVVVASRLGVNSISIGIFVGAFAVALGLWMTRVVKKKYIPYQKEVFALASFLLTILPLKSLWTDYTSLYVSLAGDYGSLLNRTYLINKFLLGSVIGGVLLFVSPFLSRGIIRLRQGKSVPFQGMALTLLLLIVSATLIQIL